MGIFMEFMEREGCSILLHFWLMAENFREQLTGKDGFGQVTHMGAAVRRLFGVA
jgi:hypothetical protein